MHAVVAWRLERRWAFFGLAGLSLMMFSIDSSIVAVALKTLIEDLDTSLVWAGWTLTAYALTQTIVMPIVGKLAEQFGQMRVFVICVALFTLGSLLCGLAPNIYVLIACRVLQALGGGGFMPSATGIVAQQFPQTRSQMIGLFASIFPIGGIIGPNLGGFIVQHFSWRDIFLVNVPIGMIVLPLLLLEMRRTPSSVDVRPASRRKVDVLGSSLFAGTIVTFLTALTLLGEDPSFLRTPFFWLLLVTSVGMLVAFIWQESRAAAPILELSLVARHPFLVINVYNFLYGTFVFGCFSFIPYLASVEYGLGPFESGAVLTPRSLAMIVTSTITSLVLMRLGYRLPILVGLLLVIASLLMVGQGWTGFELGPISLGPFGILAVSTAVGGFGSGLLTPSSNNAGLDLLPERAGVIAGLRGLFRSTGGVIGTAIIVVVLELSPDKASGLKMIFTVMGLLLLATVPLAMMIPDTAGERRRDRHSRQQDDAGTPEPSPGSPASAPSTGGASTWTKRRSGRSPHRRAGAG
ncbi:MAG: MFS transporter [Chloroflexi bacterium]|nr:MFS transporter [Chloroflexota bacterium]